MGEGVSYSCTVLPGDIRGYQRLRGGRTEGPPLQSSESTAPPTTLSSWTKNPQNRQKCLVLSHPVCGTFYSTPWERIYLLMVPRHPKSSQRRSRG